MNLCNRLKPKCFIIIGYLLTLFSIVSCKDYLDVVPKDQVTDTTVFQSIDNAELFLNTIYSELPDVHNDADPIAHISDNARTPVADYSSRKVINIGAQTPDNNPYGGRWTINYSNIRRANSFINKVEASDLSEEWKNQKLAEARFLRAYYYQDLLKFFGGVPIITEVLNRNEQGEEIFYPRATFEETVQFITNECEEIINDLPLNTSSGKASRGAALTLKGWVELFAASPLNNPNNDETKWNLAAETFKRVIDLNIYSLYRDYYSMFLEENNNDSETIFARKYLGGNSSLGGSLEGLLGIRYSNGDRISVGSTNPTQELVDAYRMENGLPINDPESGYDPQNPYSDREQRFYDSIIYDGTTWREETVYMRRGVGSLNEIDFQDNDATTTGYYRKKAMNEEYAEALNNHLSSADHIIFRYGEVLLSYAEALNEAEGPTNEVYEAVNQIRERGQIPSLEQSLSQGEMREVIHRERRVELAFEGKRWFDLTRWMKAEEKLNGSLHRMLIEQEGSNWVYEVIPIAGGERTFHADRNYYFPIPQSAIDRNSELEQNSGY